MITHLDEKERKLNLEVDPTSNKLNYLAKQTVEVTLPNT